MQRLLKKIGLKEGTDCYLRINNLDEDSGIIELLLNEKAIRKHKGYWDDENNYAEYYYNEEKNPDVIGAIRWELNPEDNDVMSIYVAYFEIMPEYRGLDCFYMLLNKFNDQVVQPIQKKYGEDKVYIDAIFDNEKLGELLPRVIKNVYINEDYNNFNFFNEVFKPKLKNPKKIEELILNNIWNERFGTVLIKELLKNGFIFTEELLINMVNERSGSLFFLIDAGLPMTEDLIKKLIMSNPDCIEGLQNTKIKVTKEMALLSLKIYHNLYYVDGYFNIPLDEEIQMTVLPQSIISLKILLELNAPITTKVYEEYVNRYGEEVCTINGVPQPVKDFANKKITKEEFYQQMNN